MNDSALTRWTMGLLLACVSGVALAVGPSRSAAYDEQTGQVLDGLPPITTSTKLSLAIPVFDPGISGDLPSPYHKDEKRDQVFNEVRRAEANLLATQLREEFAQTGVFEKVRVTPNDQAIGELYLLGRIMRSTSEDLHVEVRAIDISQRTWFHKIYKQRVDEDAVSQPARLRKIDPYEPLYRRIVENVITELAEYDDRDLRELKGIADMVFAASYSQETYGDYLDEKRIRVDGERFMVTTLAGLPAAEDEQYQRILAIRAQEELFLDDLQQHYDQYAARARPVYDDWQSDAHPLAVQARQERAKSTRRKVFAGLAAAAGVAAGSEANEFKTVALAGSAALAYTAFRASREYKAVAESLSELGESVDIQLAPSNIEFEGRTEQLQGTAAKQYQDMRNFLREVYEEEATPERQLVIDSDR